MVRGELVLRCPSCPPFFLTNFAWLWFLLKILLLNWASPRSEMFLYTRLSDISLISITTKWQTKQKTTGAMLKNLAQKFNINMAPTIERLSITFASNGKREFVQRDQVSSLLVIYCSLFLLVISSFTRCFIHNNCFELFLSADFLF